MAPTAGYSDTGTTRPALDIVKDRRQAVRWPFGRRCPWPPTAEDHRPEDCDSRHASHARAPCAVCRDVERTWRGERPDDVSLPMPSWTPAARRSVRGMGSADPRIASPAATPVTYLLIDGENLDATLGTSVLNRKPHPDERPRWERLIEFADRRLGGPVRALFFINASSGSMPMSFVQALLAIGYRPVPLSGPPNVKVVDVGIQRTLEAIAAAGLPANVVLGSHDGDFVPQIEALLDGDRRVAVVGFREFVSSSFGALVSKGLEIVDLEEDARAFNYVLPRVRIIDLDDFDPTAYL